jgi:endo-1,4-beta-D-glucanase Y
MTTTPSYDRMIPLRSDAAIEERVRSLVGRANMRQLWLMFLDHDDVQLERMVVIDGLPGWPTRAETAELAANVARDMGATGAHGLILVWERWGPAHFTENDTQWVRALAKSCRAEAIGLRAMLLSHRTGVRWIAADDYLE